MTAQKIYTKTPLPPERILEKLKGNGLVVPNKQVNEAINYVRYIGAYRLKGYWFELVDSNKNFPVGFAFEQLRNRYEFDNELRAVTIAASDRLEVAVRAVMANYLSLKHSPHWFLKPEVFSANEPEMLRGLHRKIVREVERSKDKRFVKHYFDKYDEPSLPPSWVISECVSFGMWSKAYRLLNDPNDKKAISSRFGIDKHEVFSSWLHSLSVLRNIAAHNGRLIANPLHVMPLNFSSRKAGVAVKHKDPRAFYSMATIISYLLQQTALPNTWISDLKNLFAKFPEISIGELGFPEGWESNWSFSATQIVQNAVVSRE